MDVGRMEEILKDEFGICSREELDAAISKFPGIDLGIFISPLTERGVRSEWKNQKPATA